ncbi:lipase family protein [Sorangium sp. So ce124]|uniref:lipase family protein n=1 Tax=Sorangium sp. So ce124 TaxID=3133280 RepID=UPI003F60819B
MKNEHLWPGDGVPNLRVEDRVTNTLQRAIAHFPEEWAAAAAASTRAVDLVDSLANVRPGAYDHTAASVLATASMWAYSSNEEIVRMMDRARLPCIGVTLALENQSLLLDALVHFIQSRDGRVAIISFRGSQILPYLNINWLANINIAPEPFHAAGRVHGGFHTGIMPVWPRVKDFLIAAKNGESICHTMQRVAVSRRCPPESWNVDNSASCGEASNVLEHGARRLSKAKLLSVVQALEEALRYKLEALYLTGHSLGGSLAVLAAALIHTEEELRELRPLLRGIYTFGQPMVGDPTFARHFQGEFGNKLFRHIYGKDVMPHLPPRTAGTFEHFGQEYRSTPQGWTSNGRPVGQARIGGCALLSGLGGYLAEQFSVRGLLPDLPAVDWVKERLVPPLLRRQFLFRYSLADHMPINYLRTSRAPIPGSEFL